MLTNFTFYISLQKNVCFNVFQCRAKKFSIACFPLRSATFPKIHLTWDFTEFQVRAARNLLSAVTRLLILADMIDVHLLLQTLVRVEDDLELLKNVNSQAELLDSIKRFGTSAQDLMSQAAKRQHELKVLLKAIVLFQAYRPERSGAKFFCKKTFPLEREKVSQKSPRPKSATTIARWLTFSNFFSVFFNLFFLCFSTFFLCFSTFFLCFSGPSPERRLGSCESGPEETLDDVVNRVKGVRPTPGAGGSQSQPWLCSQAGQCLAVGNTATDKLLHLG